MLKKNPGEVAYKVTNTLANGFFALGILGLIFVTPFLSSSFTFFLYGTPYGISSIVGIIMFALAFIILAILYSLYKLGELIDNDKINLGIKIIAGGFALIFFMTPIGVLGYSDLVYIGVFITLILAVFLFVIGNFLLFMGLREYGIIEGSKTIANFSLVLAILSIIEIPLSFVSTSVNMGLNLLYIGIYMFLIGVIFNFTLILAFIAFIAIGLEFDKISKKVKMIIKEKLSEIKSETDGKNINELKQISKDKGIPFILLASLRLG